jgi:hypothetical protein
MSFAGFPQLPLEIRELIWKFSLTCRIVHIEPFIDSNRPKYKSRWGEQISRPSFTSRTPPPAPISVNSESRRIALQSYIAIKCSHSPPNQYFYFNSSLDTISIRWYPHPHCQVDWLDVLHAIAQQDPNGTHKVKSLAISGFHISSWIFPMSVGDCVELDELFVLDRSGWPSNSKQVARIDGDEVVTVRPGMPLEGELKNWGTLEILVRQLEAKKDELLGGRMPVVKAVREEVWLAKGLSFLNGKKP